MASETSRPHFWPLYVAGALFLLAALGPMSHAWLMYDLKHGVPRTDFYTAEAWADCAAMHNEAASRGAKYWTCHDPKERAP